ncbi:MAG TPA: ABC transporter substrate-binding protein [Candidatus Nanoarchaeia archaeon]|nr:ABC transporter substrate-binding protein [Candidatus Nanoarchaeia archaeon]
MKWLFLLVLLLIVGCSKEPYLIGISTWGPLATYSESVEGFKEGLALEGFNEGEHVNFIVESAEFDIEKQIHIIEKFINADVDMIYSITAQGTLITKATTPETPVVFNAMFPVELGLVDSMDYSGNNVVGVIGYVPPQRQARYFNQLFPSMKSMAFLRHAGEPNSKFQQNDFSFFFEPNGINVIDVEISEEQDIQKKLAPIAGDVDVIYVSCDNKLKLFEKNIVEVSSSLKKPVITCINTLARKNGVLFVGTNYRPLGRLTAQKAAQILRGAKPTNLKTEIPENDYIIVNLDAASRAGITVPQSLLDIADEVINEVQQQ